MARATLAPRAGMTAPVPPLRPRPIATMKDMGMDMSGMQGMEGMDMSAGMGSTRGVDPTAEQHASAKLATDRKSVVKGKSVSVRVVLGGRLNIEKKTETHKHQPTQYLD